MYQQSEETEEVTLPEWKEGYTLPGKGCSLTEGKTKPKPLHTEATLLSAMQDVYKRQIKKRKRMEIITLDHQVYQDLVTRINRISDYVFKKAAVPTDCLLYTSI